MAGAYSLASAIARFRGSRQHVSDDDDDGAAPAPADGVGGKEAHACACQMLGGDASALLEFNNDFANDIVDATDRVLVNAVAATAQALLLGVADVLEFQKDLTADHINIIVKFPPRTCIDLEQFLAIKFLNEVRIRKIWVQPEVDYVGLCVSVWRADTPWARTVMDVILLRRRVSAGNGDAGVALPPAAASAAEAAVAGKRRRTSAPQR